MKKIVLLFAALFPFSLMAQGVIQGFYTIPASPAATDEIKVVAELSFTSGDCPLDNKGHSTNGTRTDAYTHHCVGLLAVICNTTDTFTLGTLPAGSHTFALALSSGGGPIPCSPGIVPDDNDSITFTVDPGVGIAPVLEEIFSVYPNPSDNFITVHLVDGSVQASEVKIYNTQGQLVILNKAEGKKSMIDISSLAPGLYYVSVESEKGTAVKKFEVIR